ncbi:MAG: ABC transporter ATP-binding protein [Bacillus sp. (in: firmicutes)]
MKSFRKLLNYIKPYMWIALLGPFFMFIEIAMDLIQPTIMQNIIDNGIAGNDQAYVVTMGIWMIVSAVIGLFGGIGSSIYSTRTAVNVAADLRNDVFRKIGYFSGPNTDQFGTGKLITIVTNDITTLQQAIMMTLRIFVRGPIMFVGSIIIVFFTARELFPILMIVVPILVALIVIFTMKAGSLFQKVQEAVDRVNTKLQENLAGMRVVKAFGRQTHEVNQFQKVNDDLTKVNIRADQVIMGLSPILLFIVNLGIVAAIWMGAIKVDNGTVNVGVIVAFINYLTIIMNSLMTSSHVLMQITRAFPSGDRIMQVLDTEEDIKQDINAQKPDEVRGDLKFKNVCYSYSKNGEYVLSNLNFHIKSGQTIGVIGSTGSGKSSLVQLLPRLYDVDEGEILLDGINVNKYELETLRQEIGFVPQKALLFSGSIKNNLQYGKKNATEEEMRQAIVSAQAAEFVRKLDGELDYSLTQGATNLSGGQKQRISIARAFIRKPAIIVLDDSTSAVDALSEAAIQKVLRNEFEGTTKIIVSSKISSIKNADQIIVLEDGKMAGIGTHEQLIADNALYQEIYATQIGKEVGAK